MDYLCKHLMCHSRGHGPVRFSLRLLYVVFCVSAYLWLLASHSNEFFRHNLSLCVSHPYCGTTLLLLRLCTLFVLSYPDVSVQSTRVVGCRHFLKICLLYITMGYTNRARYWNNSSARVVSMPGWVGITHRNILGLLFSSKM